MSESRLSRVSDGTRAAVVSIGACLIMMGVVIIGITKTANTAAILLLLVGIALLLAMIPSAQAAAAAEKEKKPPRRGQ